MQEIVVSIEPYSACQNDVAHMLRASYREALRPITGKDLYFNKRERLRLDEQGLFVMAVAREQSGAAVGFCSMAIRRSWYDGRQYGSGDAVFVMPEHRKGSLARRLWRAAELETFRRGADEVQFIAPVTLLGKIKLWFRMGYVQTGTVVTKRRA